MLSWPTPFGKQPPDTWRWLAQASLVILGHNLPTPGLSSY